MRGQASEQTHQPASSDDDDDEEDEELPVPPATGSEEDVSVLILESLALSSAVGGILVGRKCESIHLRIVPHLL